MLFNYTGDILSSHVNRQGFIIIQLPLAPTSGRKSKVELRGRRRS